MAETDHTLDIRENYEIGPLTTLGVGGSSRRFVRATSSTQLIAAVQLAEQKGWPRRILGGGSNVLIDDEPFGGLTIQIASRGVQSTEQDNNVELTVEAGEPWSELVRKTAKKGWAGFECLGGIPGLVGATPIQNVGAYGQEVSETITKVEVFDTETGERSAWTNEQCLFSYRDSFFKQAKAGRYLILAVSFRLRKDAPPSLRYPELSKAVTQALQQTGGDEPSVELVHDIVIGLRRAKAMVLDSDDPNSRSAGSFFTNPILKPEQAARLLTEFPNMPQFPAQCRDGSDGRKLAAAWLIERAGFTKGSVLGQAGTSQKHALALINLGGASSDELIALAENIRRAVFKTFSVVLEPEPRLIGCQLRALHS